MNSINSQKYGNVSNAIEEKPVESERFREIYDFYGLVKVKQHGERLSVQALRKTKNYVENWENHSKLEKKC